MNEMMKTMAETMARKIALYKIYKNEDDFKENKRYCPFFSEWKGLEQACGIFGIEFKYEFSGTDYQITAVTIGEYRVEC